MDPKLLDPSIVGAFPRGCRILTITKHGETNWSIGFKITVRLFIDPPKAQHAESFFVKITSRASYLPMAQAEYEGQLGLSRVIPQHTVKPVAWGSYRRFDHSQKLKTFTWFLAPFHTLRPATPRELSSMLPLIIKAIQQNSVSPSGKFGFHIAPFFGPPRMQHVTNWTSSWEEIFTREFRSNLAYLLHSRARELKDSELNDLVRLAEQFIVKVIPRLLRPLQTGGRNIKPVLLHGDLWHGNMSIDTATGQMIIFDPYAFYGHQEMKLQCWAHNRYHEVPGGSGLKLGKMIRRYEEVVRADEPVDDFEDRVRLSAARNEIASGGIVRKGEREEDWRGILEGVKEEMKRLLGKYPEGIAGFEMGLTPTAARAETQVARKRRRVRATL
ncbi:Fructosamine kinase-domain-containing protein [Sordaria sp. MPI-SDFR-AT-0083]|nr:Fructosamine kinase-domain-containing protein [Sordaria sp. MPI-SDFR-AT-0083]